MQGPCFTGKKNTGNIQIIGQIQRNIQWMITAIAVVLIEVWTKQFHLINFSLGMQSRDARVGTMKSQT
jgi:hypothetical protein